MLFGRPFPATSKVVRTCAELGWPPLSAGSIMELARLERIHDAVLKRLMAQRGDRIEYLLVTP